jgi:lipopolysaccharide/colanic/teichoic acid biosynthesis glycosyltransferase
MLQGEERRILDVKPGITDWASIWNSNEADALKGSPDPEATYEQLIRPTKIQLQLRYAREHSVAVDLKILFHTFLKLLNPAWVPKELASVKPVGAYKDLVKI